MAAMQDRLDEVSELTDRLQKAFPDETRGFMTFLHEAEGGAAVPLKTKELINTALAVAAQCEWCVAFHVQHAVAAGATRQELVEAGFQAVLMHGGPAFMWMTPLLRAIDEFAPPAGE
jgi:AhpD family alkylhydroperoxidase